jgi:hypothetical protein
MLDGMNPVGIAMRISNAIAANTENTPRFLEQWEITGA